MTQIAHSTETRLETINFLVREAFNGRLQAEVNIIYGQVVPADTHGSALLKASLKDVAGKKAWITKE